MIPQLSPQTQSIKEILLEAGLDIKNDIKKSVSNSTVVGFFCLASSVIRKDENLKKIQSLISDFNMPLYVKDCSPYNNHIKLRIIEFPSFYEFGNAVTKLISPGMYLDVQNDSIDNSIRLFRSPNTVARIAQKGRKITEDQFNEKLNEAIQEITKAA